MNKRLEWIDALRALAIILVVLGHQVPGKTEFFVFTSPVKLPLFFAISGYLFNSRNGNTIVFFKNWFIKLVVPWICLAMIPQIPRVFLGRVGFFEILNMFISGEAVWFMPCFVIGEAIHYFILKYAKKESRVILASVSVAALGFVAHNLDILNYAMINRAFVVQMFFLIGFEFKHHESFFVNISWKVVLSVLFIYFVLCSISLYIYPDQCLDVHHNRYYNLPFCLILILIGNFALFTIASKTNFSNRILSEIGKNTLVIYIWHEYAILALSAFGTVLGYDIHNVWVKAIVNTIWAIVVCYVCALGLNKFTPVIVGKRRK